MPVQNVEIARFVGYRMVMLIKADPVCRYQVYLPVFDRKIDLFES